MSFEQNGKKMKLQGDPSLCKSQFSLKSLFKENEVEFMGMVFVENIRSLVGTEILQPKFFGPKMGVLTELKLREQQE
ncbi:hypothetical protein CR513_35078, partial [Mucuna pruriens]